MSTELQTMVEEINRDWQEFKTDFVASEETKGKADTLLLEKIERINTSITESQVKMDDLVKKDKLKEIRDDLAEVKDRVFSPAFSQSKDTKEDPHTKAFIEHMRKRSSRTESALEEFDAKAVK